MNASKANLLNALTLLILGSWGAYATQMGSNTALIPIIGGVILLACQKGVTAENKVIAHVAVLVTFILIIGTFVKPFLTALNNDNTMALVRSSLIIITGIIAMIFFIKSFRDARIARENAA